MVTFGAVNLLRMAPRLAPIAGGRPALWAAAVGHLRRNALIEAALGLIVLAIVGLLGILPPGLHSSPAGRCRSASSSARSLPRPRWRW